MPDFPHGTCECTSGFGSGCCHGQGPAAFQVIRDGKKVRLCTKCDLKSDRPTRVCLVTPAEPIQPYAEFDPLGALCIVVQVFHDVSKPRSPHA